MRKGDDLTTFTVPKVVKNPEALIFRIPKGLFRPVAGKLYIYCSLLRVITNRFSRSSLFIWCVIQHCFCHPVVVYFCYILYRVWFVSCYSRVDWFYFQLVQTLFIPFVVNLFVFPCSSENFHLNVDLFLPFFWGSKFRLHIKECGEPVHYIFILEDFCTQVRSKVLLKILSIWEKFASFCWTSFSFSLEVSQPRYFKFLTCLKNLLSTIILHLTWSFPRNIWYFSSDISIPKSFAVFCNVNTRLCKWFFESVIMTWCLQNEECSFL